MCGFSVSYPAEAHSPIHCQRIIKLHFPVWRSFWTHLQVGSHAPVLQADVNDLREADGAVAPGACQGRPVSGPTDAHDGTRLLVALEGQGQSMEETYRGIPSSHTCP